MKSSLWLVGAALISSCGDPAPACGDLVVQPGEECDGEAPYRADCTLPICGNGIIDAAVGEACDDSNNAPATAAALAWASRRAETAC